MAHSITHGVTHGATHGVVRGSAVSFPVDATSGKGVPLTQADWDAVFSTAGVASKTVANSWGFQDAGGSTAVVATVGTDLATTGVTFNQAVTGWSRVAVTWADGANARAEHATGVGSNPATTSVLWIGYIDLTATPATNRLVLSPSINGAPAWNGTINSTPRIRTLINGVQNVGASNPVTGGVRPIVVLNDRTGSRAMMYSDQEKLTGTYSASIGDGSKGFGSTGASAAAMATLWGAQFAGANAEWDDATVKAVLEALNWTIPWS